MWPKALITPCCPRGLLYIESFPAIVPFRSSHDMPQLMNCFAERLKPAVDHKRRGKSSRQERACPCGSKIDLPSWNEHLQGGERAPLPLLCGRPCPSSGAGQCPKNLRKKKKKISLHSLFHPRSACGFLTAATWPQKSLMRNTAFHVLHTRQLL